MWNIRAREPEISSHLSTSPLIETLSTGDCLRGQGVGGPRPGGSYQIICCCSQAAPLLEEEAQTYFQSLGISYTGWPDLGVWWVSDGVHHLVVEREKLLDIHCRDLKSDCNVLHPNQHLGLSEVELLPSRHSGEWLSHLLRTASNELPDEARVYYSLYWVQVTVNSSQSSVVLSSLISYQVFCC